MVIESIETLISTILTASIAGAGLVIAVYALIVPISSKIFERRLDVLKRRLKQFDDVKTQTTPEEVAKDTKTLKTLAGEIKELKAFPRYLGPLVFMDFVLFSITALYSLFWFLGTSEDIQAYVIVAFFTISILLFAAVGMGAIIDVYGSMKREFEQLRKEKEKAEEDRKRLEEIKRKFSELNIVGLKKAKKGETEEKKNH